MRNWLRGIRKSLGDEPGPNDDANWRDYAFPDPYDYEVQGAFFTCEGCEKIARRYLASGKIATRCEHCGHLGYWVYFDEFWPNRHNNPLAG